MTGLWVARRQLNTFAPIAVAGNRLAYSGTENGVQGAIYYLPLGGDQSRVGVRVRNPTVVPLRVLMHASVDWSRYVTVDIASTFVNMSVGNGFETVTPVGPNQPTVIADGDIVWFQRDLDLDLYAIYRNDDTQPLFTWQAGAAATGLLDFKPKAAGAFPGLTDDGRLVTLTYNTSVAAILAITNPSGTPTGGRATIASTANAAQAGYATFDLGSPVTHVEGEFEYAAGFHCWADPFNSGLLALVSNASNCHTAFRPGGWDFGIWDRNSGLAVLQTRNYAVARGNDAVQHVSVDLDRFAKKAVVIGDDGVPVTISDPRIGIACPYGQMEIYYNNAATEPRSEIYRFLAQAQQQAIAHGRGYRSCGVRLARVGGVSCASIDDIWMQDVVEPIVLTNDTFAYTFPIEFIDDTGVALIVPAAYVTASAPAPAVTAGAVIVAPPALVTATAPVPVVRGGALLTAPAATVATSAPAPVVRGGAVVLAPAALVATSAPAPSSVIGGASGAAGVTAPVALVSTTAPAPTVAAGATVAAPPAQVATTAPAPTSATGAAAVTAPAATVSTSAPAPTPAGGATVVAPPALVSTSAPAPSSVTGLSGNAYVDLAPSANPPVYGTRQAGDLLVHVWLGYTTPGTPTGWTSVASGQFGATGLFYRVVKRTATNTSADNASSSNGVGGVGHVYRGATTVGVVAANGANSNSVGFPAAAFNSTASWAMRVAWVNQATNVNTGTIAGYTNRYTAMNQLTSKDTAGSVGSNPTAVSQAINVTNNWGALTIEVT